MESDKVENSISHWTFVIIINKITMTMVMLVTVRDTVAYGKCFERERCRLKSKIEKVKANTVNAQPKRNAHT